MLLAACPLSPCVCRLSFALLRLKLGLTLPLLCLCVLAMLPVAANFSTHPPHDMFPLLSLAGSLLRHGSEGYIGYESQGGTGPANYMKSLKKMTRRLFKPNTLDFETAMWEIFHLIINPKKMYRSQYYSKANGKNSYARDDPSFLILLTIFLSISAVAWGLAYSPHVLDIIKLILYMVVVDFYLTGVMVSTVSWLVANKIFNNTWGLSASNKYYTTYIEWGFCFDIHCNSFLIIWCVLYLLQFILLPVITINNSFLSLLLGNTLYYGAVSYYFVITFYGFNSLPFINTQSINAKFNDNPGKMLQLIFITGVLPVLAVLYLLSLVFRINVALIMNDTYFN